MRAAPEYVHRWTLASARRRSTPRSFARWSRLESRAVGTRRLPAQHRIALEQPTLIDGQVDAELLHVEATALREEIDGILPTDRVDGGGVDAGALHRARRLRHLEGVAHSPIR